MSNPYQAAIEWLREVWETRGEQKQVDDAIRLLISTGRLTQEDKNDIAVLLENGMGIDRWRDRVWDFVDSLPDTAPTDGAEVKDEGQRRRGSFRG